MSVRGLTVNMYKAEREKEILDELKKTGYSTVEYLSKKLHISPSSVRRDLRIMESKGIVSRSYGGVELADSVNRNVPFSLRTHENPREKKKVAQAAATLIKEGNVLFIDGSSTAFFLIEEIVNIKGITVITNSIEGLYYLSQFGVRVVSTGGVVSSENNAVLVDSIASSVIENVRADIAFFSTQSVSEKGEIYDCYLSEIPLRNQMLKNSKIKVFLCDSNKVGKTAAWRMCHIDDVDYIVSDRDISDCFEVDVPHSKFILAQ